MTVHDVECANMNEKPFLCKDRVGVLKGTFEDTSEDMAVKCGVQSVLETAILLRADRLACHAFFPTLALTGAISGTIESGSKCTGEKRSGRQKEQSAVQSSTGSES